MSVNYDNWKQRYNHFPSWQCPNCQQGTLLLNEESLKETESQHSISAREELAWEPNWIDERFCGILICSNKTCGEVSIISGHTSYWDHPNEDYSEQIWEKDYVPKFIYPSPNIFHLAKECPHNITENLKRSFSLFWPDKAACANGLRTTVETFLSDRGVSEHHQNNKGETKPVPLQARINEYKTKEPETAELIEAIKWLGNVGSHNSPYEPELKDLLAGFEIFEHVIEKTYIQREKDLHNKAQALINGKGRTS